MSMEIQPFRAVYCLIMQARGRTWENTYGGRLTYGNFSEMCKMVHVNGEGIELKWDARDASLRVSRNYLLVGPVVVCLFAQGRMPMDQALVYTPSSYHHVLRMKGLRIATYVTMRSPNRALPSKWTAKQPDLINFSMAHISSLLYDELITTTPAGR